MLQIHFHVRDAAMPKCVDGLFEPKEIACPPSDEEGAEVLGDLRGDRMLLSSTVNWGELVNQWFYCRHEAVPLERDPPEIGMGEDLGPVYSDCVEWLFCALGVEAGCDAAAAAGLAPLATLNLSNLRRRISSADAEDTPPSA